MQKSNARRFIEAYNQIDYALRVQHNFKRSMGYSDMIRRAVAINAIVRKYEDDLIDYGRLRNAIIHRSSEDYIIAEPHDDVVLALEKIARLICTPPKVLETLELHDVLTVQYDVPLKKVIELISTSKYSNIPVYKNGTLVGVANGQKILDLIGRAIADNKDMTDYIESTSIEEAVNSFSVDVKYFEIESASVTIERILDLFNKNRKLLLVLITKTGSLQEPPLGIVTSSNLMDLNSIIESY